MTMTDTPRECLACYADNEAVEVLVQAGANVNYASFGYDVVTPLIVACKYTTMLALLAFFWPQNFAISTIPM